MAVKPIKIGKTYFEQDVPKRNVKQTPLHQTEHLSSNSNGNLDIDRLFNKLSNKIDNIQSTNIYGESHKNTGVIEVDIKKQIAIDKVDKNAVKSQEIKGKVNNKLDKLRALRKR
tara:strand:- start:4565 stop:4906 length:342 start_codon:yes stop_codon:yes gene_type:complete